MIDGSPLVDEPVADESVADEPLRPRRSMVWSVAWPALYRIVRLLDPLIRSWIAGGLPGLDGIVELRYVGPQTGRPRRVLVTLLSTGGRWYVGHPNGQTSWLRAIQMSGSVEVEPPGAQGPHFRVEPVPLGAERDAIIRATAHQQPFPADLLYRAAQRHIAAVGVYVRLVPEPAARTLSAPSLVPASGV